MGTKSCKIYAGALIFFAFLASIPMASADVTSPMIKDRGRKYTEEKPLTTYYGTGAAGRMTEASELRFQAESLFTAGEWEKAIPVAKKAVQFDAGDPMGHLILARALTQKFYQQKGAIDEKLLAECLREWQLIRYHDADPTEQWEAGNNAKRLIKIARALEKEKKERMRIEEEKLQAQLAAKAVPAQKQKVAVTETVSVRKISDEEEQAEWKSEQEVKKAEATSPKPVSVGGPKGELSPELKQLAARKKRFGIF